MKPALTFLLALAAAAHAQFAVMHNNGVVTSPSNLTIQQSNVAGLSNALAGKLATNGSAAGLTGFVGTTNAETARNNLGISNTFAGQFHADFYDDFSRYSNGTAVGQGANPLIGSAYTLRLGSTNYTNPPKVADGKLFSTNGEIFYLTTELSRPVYNFGAVFEFDQQEGGNIFTILIQPDTTWIGRVLHISVSPLSIGADVSTNGVLGFGGSNTIIWTNFGSAAAVPNRVKQVITGQIDGNTLFLTYAGRSFSVSHPQLSNVVGRYYSFESFYTTNTLTNRIHAVWANSPSLQNFWSHSFNDSLAQIANGYGRLENNLIVATNPAAFVSELGTDKVLADGNIIARGLVRGRLGSNSIIGSGAPMVAQSGGGVGNSSTTNLTELVTFNVYANMLTNNWSRWAGTFVGSFANNTNGKRVVLNMAGTRLDTGNLNESGEWKIDAIVYRSTSNSHEAFAMFQSENTSKTARWTFNNGAGVQFNVQAQGAANSNNEVILRGAWADWYP